MKIMIKASKLTLITGIFLCFGCQNQNLPQSLKLEVSDLKERFTNDAIAAAIQEMQNKHGLIPVATGGSGPDKIKNLTTWYVYRGKVDVAFARILFLDAAQELINQINARKELNPFLYEVPFTTDRANVCIFFEDQNGRPLKLGELSQVDIYKNEIYYKTEIKNENIIVIYKESIIEALANVEKQKNLPEKATPSQM